MADIILVNIILLYIHCILLLLIEYYILLNIHYTYIHICIHCCLSRPGDSCKRDS